MEPGSDGNIVLHGFVHGAAAYYQKRGAVEIVFRHIQIVLMLLGDCVPQKERVLYKGGDRLISGVVDSTAILRRQLHVFISAFAPVGGNIRERPFQFSFLSPGVRA